MQWSFGSCDGSIMLFGIFFEIGNTCFSHMLMLAASVMKVKDYIANRGKKALGALLCSLSLHFSSVALLPHSSVES